MGVCKILAGVVVGIVGAIGAGKSSVAKSAASQIALRVIDADSAGHLALHETAVKANLVSTFGNSILDETGEIVRSRLASLVFGPSESSQKCRQLLERIVHPAIRNRIEAEILSEHSLNIERPVLLDAPVLFEAGWNQLCDSVVFVDAPYAIRLKRLQASRGWDSAELDRREASQLSLIDKKQRCQRVINNVDDVDVAGRELARYLLSLSSANQRIPRRSRDDEVGT